MAYTNPEDARTRQAAYNAAHKDEFSIRDAARYAAYAEWLHALNSTWKCDTCGGLVELWHHKDPSTKRCDVAGMYGHSLDSIEDELEKCLPMCRPCHQRLHHAKGEAR